MRDLGLELEININNDLHIVKASGQFCDTTLSRLSEALEMVYSQFFLKHFLLWAVVIPPSPTFLPTQLAALAQNLLPVFSPLNVQSPGTS